MGSAPATGACGAGRSSTAGRREGPV